MRTSAICTLERLFLPFLPCEGMEGKSKWKPRGRACSNCSTGPRQGLKLEEGETSGDSCIHEFRHWQITLTIRIPRIVRGLIRDVCVHPLPLIATSDYNGTVATWRQSYTVARLVPQHCVEKCFCRRSLRSRARQRSCSFVLPLIVFVRVPRVFILRFDGISRNQAQS